MRRIANSFFASILLTVLPTSLPAQAADFKDVLSGSVAPLTLQLKNLDATWSMADIGNSTADNGLGDMYAAMLEGGTGGGYGGDTYFTQGDVVKIGDSTFLVTYHIKTNPVDIRKLFGGQNPIAAPAGEKLTGGTTLVLSLENQADVAKFSNVRPFNLDQILKDSDATAKATTESAVPDDSGGPNQDPSQQPYASDDDRAVSYLKQIGLGIMQYCQDYDQKFPPMKSQAEFKTVVYPYEKSDAVFVDPISKQPFVPNAILSEKRIAVISDPSSLVMVCSSQPSPDGKRNVLFCDGHVKRVSGTDCQLLKTACKIP